LGPHFDNTYSAWKTYGVEFPYKHLGNQRVVLSNRKFQGMNPTYPREEVRFESMFESGNLDAVFKVVMLVARLEAPNSIALCG
jgi:putative IMPACT (imprinted ancient) family translation regulator